MRLAKGKNVNLAIMLLVITLFQLTCLFTLLSKAEEQYMLSSIITFGVYIAVEYAYFIGARLVLKRHGFEVELIAFMLTSIGLSITLSVYPSKAITQLVAVLIGIVGFIVLQWILRDLKIVMALRVPAAVAGLGLLVFTLVFAGFTHGAKNWLYIGNLSIQPSELVKVAFIFVGAATLEKLQSNRSLTKYIVFALGCVGALGLMYDFGTALIFFFTFIVISFMRSGDIRTIFLVCTVALMGAVLVLMFKPYVANRFASYGHVWEYFDTSGFQQTRTMIYSAAGGLFGVGLGNGKLRDVFAATEDLVFGVVCEEFGMIMAGAILLSYVALLIYSIRHSKFARSSFYAISACAASGLMLFQASLNVFGVNDLLPLTGVTLPFISRGGSSIMCCWMLLAFIKAVDRSTYRYGGVRQ
ncbi:MAG: FtsW/RodA/SpoVE family cell cycle protein [Oscillospiraceae bacterium]|nr:FtsW/RodA/SpoVE family cell cycle protein [Oscillospiraceae bacterium]